MRHPIVVAAISVFLVVAGTQLANAQTCAECWEDGPFWARTHALLGPSYGGDVIGPPHSLIPPGCPGPHGGCGVTLGPEMEAVETFVTAVAEGAPADELSRYLTQLKRIITINRDRSAIELSDCHGDVIAFVPLERRELDRVSQQAGILR